MHLLYRGFKDTDKIHTEISWVLKEILSKSDDTEKYTISSKVTKWHITRSVYEQARTTATRNITRYIIISFHVYNRHAPAQRETLCLIQDFFLILFF